MQTHISRMEKLIHKYVSIYCSLFLSIYLSFSLPYTVLSLPFFLFLIFWFHFNYCTLLSLYAADLNHSVHQFVVPNMVSLLYSKRHGKYAHITRICSSLSHSVFDALSIEFVFNIQQCPRFKGKSQLYLS